MIFGPDGQPVTSERVAMERMTRFNPCKGLTPDVLTTRLVAFARGELRDLAWTMEWVEKHDDTTSIVADKAKRAVSRYGWDIAIDDDVDAADKALAEEQARILRRFYKSLVARHSVDLEQRGRMGLFAKQLMDAYGKGYSVHHVVWKPTPRGLTAEVVHVPLWFFEATKGGMAFLESQWAVQGKPLASLGGPGAWMVAVNRGAMLANVIAWMFKHIPLQDWLTYCDRHGMPGFVGKTTSEPGSAGWSAMRSAVAGMGSEFGAVLNKADTLEILDMTAQGTIPYPELVDRMDRAITILWRGGDLGTMSRGNNAVGSNSQSEDTDDLDADNSVWVGETIDMQLGRRVIDYYFGADAPMLASLSIGRRTRDDQSKQLEATKTFVAMGGRVSRAWYSKTFAVPEASETETDLLSPEKKPDAGATMPPEISAANDANGAAFQAWVARARRLAPARSLWTELLATLDRETATDAEIRAAAAELVRKLPDMFDPLDTGDVAAALAGEMGRALVG